jgi:hypothetical protein
LSGEYTSRAPKSDAPARAVAGVRSDAMPQVPSRATARSTARQRTNRMTGPVRKPRYLPRRPEALRPRVAPGLPFRDATPMWGVISVGRTSPRPCLRTGENVSGARVWAARPDKVSACCERRAGGAEVRCRHKHDWALVQRPLPNGLPVPAGDRFVRRGAPTLVKRASALRAGSHMRRHASTARDPAFSHDTPSCSVRASIPISTSAAYYASSEAFISGSWPSSDGTPIHTAKNSAANVTGIPVTADKD